MPDVDELQACPLPQTTAAGLRLLDAAETLFYGQGIGAVGVDLIADTAGVTKRTLYQRFGSKSELVSAYLQRRAHRWQTLVLREIGRADDPETRALVVFDVAARWARDNPHGCAFVNAWAELGNTDEPAATVIRQEKEWMRELFRRLAPSRAVADHLHLLYEGAQVTGSVLGDDQAFPRAKRTARTVCAADRSAAQ